MEAIQECINRYLVALDAHTQDCLGIAHQQAWGRTKIAARNYERLPMEEKEPYRWLPAVQGAGQSVAGSKQGEDRSVLPAQLQSAIEAG